MKLSFVSSTESHGEGGEIRNILNLECTVQQKLKYMLPRCLGNRREPELRWKKTGGTKVSCTDDICLELWSCSNMKSRADDVSLA
jgi:hypothetical protein